MIENITKIETDKFVSSNIKNIREDMQNVWSGLASKTLTLSFDEAIDAIDEVKTSIETFNGALELLVKYIENQQSITNYQNAIDQEQTYPSLTCSKEYIENGIKKIMTINVVNQTLINDCLNAIKEIETTNLELKTQIEGILSSFCPVNLQPKNNTDIAHRGSHPGGIWENSLEAFIEAGERGFWGAEADVRFDENGNLVCSHNAVKSGENPISFEEYLDVCKQYGMTAIIDLKYENGITYYPDEELSPAIIEIIEEKGMMDSCVLQTNHFNDIPYIRSQSDEVRIWLLGHNSVTDANIKLAVENDVECINFNNSENNAYRIKKVTDAGLDACVWNVQTESAKQECLKQGAKYVMSDNVLGITPYQEGDEDYNDIVN